jgi:hypothetical protein
MAVHLDRFCAEHNYSADRRRRVILHRFLDSMKALSQVSTADDSSSDRPSTSRQSGNSNAGADGTNGAESEKPNGVRGLINRWRSRTPTTLSVPASSSSTGTQQPMASPRSNSTPAPVLPAASPASASAAFGSATTKGSTIVAAERGAAGSARPSPRRNSLSASSSSVIISPTPFATETKMVEARPRRGSDTAADQQKSAQPRGAGIEATSAGLDREVLASEGKRIRELLAEHAFGRQELNAGQGAVSIGGRRHVFLRAEAVSHGFFQLLAEVLPVKKPQADVIAANFLFDFGCCLGKTDQRHYAADPALSSPSPSFVESLLTLPPLMGHMGWGTMRIQAKHAHISTAPDQLSNFFLKLVVHRKYFTYSACAIVCAVACVLCGRNTQLKPTPGQRGGRGVEGA